MNTDKLMELVEKFVARKRREADEYDEQRSNLTRFDNDHKQMLMDAAREARADADELAAALRAEQAVGEEQRAREFLAEELRREGMHEDAYPVGCGGELTPYAQAAIRAIRRALGAARQSDALKGWRVIPFAGDRTGDERWEVYDENGSGGAIYLSDIGAGIVRSLLDRLAAARQSEGVVWTGKVDLICASDAVVVDGLKNPDALFKQRVEIRLAAAPGGEGEG